MKVLIVLTVIGFSAVAWSAPPSCDAQIEAYRKCEQDIRKGHGDEAKKGGDMKAEMNACFTQAGCQAPAAPQPDPKKEQCHKDTNANLKGKMQECIKKTHPNFVFPAEDQHGDEHHGGGGHGGKHGKGDMEKACGGDKTKLQAVKDCFKKNHPQKAKPDEAAMKARFDKNCADKKKCLDGLGQCKSALDDLKKTHCDCMKAIRTDANIQAARTGSASCAGVTFKAGNKKGGQEHSCDAAPKKDYCANGGYDAFKADMTARMAAHKGGHQ